MNVKMSNNNDNIEGKMKEKKRSSGGGLKLMGLCFCSNEPQIQPQHHHQHQHQHYLHYQQYQHHHHYHHHHQHQHQHQHQHHQFPNHHPNHISHPVPRVGNGRVSPVVNHPTGGNGQVSPIANHPTGGNGQVSPTANHPTGGNGRVSPIANHPTGGNERVSPIANQPVCGGGQLSPTTTAKGSPKVEPPGSKSPKLLLPPKDVIELRQNPGYSNVDIFTFEEMKLATKHFRPDHILGEGGFGVVYKGVIDGAVRRGYKTVEVAIKQLNPNGFQGDREWLTEVRYLGQLSHPNLVKLIGYCCEDEHRLLVYEYMASGCLEKHLFRRMSVTLTWLRRIKITLDAAKGLAFLHGLEQSIIYRDFKTSNILLDSNFNAKISDFGLAKEGPMGDQTHVSTRVMGTYGYAAPEYIMTGRLTARSDVYGFGVVLLEMLIGRRTLDKSRPSREHNLVEWCRPLLNNNKKLLKIIDPRIDGQYSVKEMMRVADLGYQCLSQNPKSRPLMSQVVEVLEAVYEEEAGQNMTLVPQNGGGVTLYEAPREKPDDRSPMRSRNPSPSPNPLQDNNKNNPTSNDEKASAARRRRREGRSRSEPESDYDIDELIKE